MLRATRRVMMYPLSSVVLLSPKRNSTTPIDCEEPTLRPTNGWRVFRRADAARMGQGGRQPLHTSAVGAEKDVDSVAERGTGMRVMPCFLAPALRMHGLRIEQ